MGPAILNGNALRRKKEEMFFCPYARIFCAVRPCGRDGIEGREIGADCTDWLERR
jgi:hypothetical protein